MTEVVKAAAIGIKCDAPGCGWADWSVKREDYDSYRNAPCPACGANVLTDADWKALLRFERIVRWINILFGWWPRNARSQWKSMSFSSDGTGKVTRIA